MPVTIKTKSELQAIREGGKILSEALNAVISAAKEGISTYELDQIAEKTITKHNGAKPGFKGYNGFPFTICAAVNNIVVHGFPSKEQILKNGDLFTVDCGVLYQGMNTDAARSIGIGEISNDRKRLITTAKKALKKGTEKAKPGNYTSDISKAIEKEIIRGGFKVIHDLTGHGIGKTLHEDPYILNYFDGQPGTKLKPGMVIAIEPIFSTQTHDIYTLEDDWTIVTSDGCDSVQQENTVIITETGCEVVTA